MENTTGVIIGMTLKVQIFQQIEGKFCSKIEVHSATDGLTDAIFLDGDVREEENGVYEGEDDNCGNSIKFLSETFEDAVAATQEKLKKIKKIREKIRERKRSINFFILL